MQKITHITTVHQAHDVRIFHKECISLCKSGYKVYLIAKGQEKTEIIEGVTIIPLTSQKNRLKRLFFSSKEIYIKVKKTNADIIHFHDPELIPVGILLSLQRKKVIYDAHEDLPRQIISKHWINPILRYPVALISEAIEWLASRFFLSGVIAATPKIAARFPFKKVTLVQNFPILNESKKTPQKNHKNNKKHQVAYVGGIDKTRGILENIQALTLLAKTSEVSMMLAGPFSNKELEQQIKTHPGWVHIKYYSWLNREEVIEQLHLSIAGIVVLHPTPAYIDSLPIKMFEYMLAGIPVIASNFPLWEKIINQNHCGILVDPFKPQQTADAIQWIIENPKQAQQMGENGRKAVLQKYNWSQEAEKLIKFYKKL